MSKGFKKVVIWQCGALARSLNFSFPSENNSTDWEASTKKPVQIALTFHLFFWATSNFFLDFFSAAPKLLPNFLSTSKMHAKIQIVFTLAGIWHCLFTAFLNPWDFHICFDFLKRSKLRKMPFMINKEFVFFFIR